MESCLSSGIRGFWIENEKIIISNSFNPYGIFERSGEMIFIVSITFLLISKPVPKRIVFLFESCLNSSKFSVNKSQELEERRQLVQGLKVKRGESRVA